MRKGGGKAKGSAFERLICKDLSLWVSDGQHKDVFWRSAMSGGRSTVAMAKGDKLSAQVGDISSVHRLGHAFIDKFMVECKFYKTLNYESLIKGAGTLLGFWARAVKDAKQHGKLPMLIAKQNNYPIAVCFCRKGVKLLNVVPDTIRLIVPPDDLHIILFDDFLKLKFRNALMHNERVAQRNFESQRARAKQRGIKFKFTYEEWVAWWQEQLGPEWQELRGCRKGQYVMARIGDKGPYQADNVECKLHEANSKDKDFKRGERHPNAKITEKQVRAILKDDRTLEVIAKEHGVSISTVSVIKRNKAWKHAKLNPKVLRRTRL